MSEDKKYVNWEKILSIVTVIVAVVSMILSCISIIQTKNISEEQKDIALFEERLEIYEAIVEINDVAQRMEAVFVKDEFDLQECLWIWLVYSDLRVDFSLDYYEVQALSGNGYTSLVEEALDKLNDAQGFEIMKMSYIIEKSEWYFDSEIVDNMEEYLVQYQLITIYFSNYFDVMHSENDNDIDLWEDSLIDSIEVFIASYNSIGADLDVALKDKLQIG